MGSGSQPFVSERIKLGLAAAVLLLTIVVLPRAAYGESWLSEYPVGTVHLAPTILAADVFDTGALNPQTAVIRIDGQVQPTFVSQGVAQGHWTSSESLVDGVWRIRWTWTVDTGGLSKATVYCYPQPLSDGPHAVTVSVKDTRSPATTFTDAWSFNVAEAPVFGAPTPAPGSTVKTQAPVISIPVAERGTVATYTATVNDAAATSTLAGGVLAVTGFMPSVDGTVTVVVEATDSGGNTATKAWSFRVSVYANRACTEAGCHGADYGSDNAMGPDCVSCHEASVHDSLHDADPNFSAYVTGQVSYILGRTNDGPWHDAFTRMACRDCHRSSNLVAVHLGSGSCPICHGNSGPRSSFTTWDKTCMQGACHAPVKFYPSTGAPFIQHDDATAAASHMTVAVRGLDSQGFCLNECHERGCVPACHTVKDARTDTSPPITRPSQVGSAPITWKLYPVDSQTGVAATYYSFDGAAFQVYAAADAVNGLSNALDSVRVGQHSLQFYSVDAAGNREAIRTVNYTATGTDTAPPLVVLNGVRTGPNSVVATSASLLVRDPRVPGPCSGVRSVRVSYKSYDRFWGYTFGNIYWFPVDYSFPTSAWDTTSTVPRLEDQARAGFGGGTVSAGGGGSYFVVRYYATDYSGNVSATMEDAVSIDNAAPVTTTTKVFNVWRWQLNASDYPAGVASTYYAFDGAPFVRYTSADAAAGGVTNTQPGGESAGSHTLAYYSVDTLGQTEAVKTLGYTIP